MKVSTRRLKAIYPYWVVGKIAVLLLIHLAWLHLVETVWRGWLFKRSNVEQKTAEPYPLNEQPKLGDNCKSNYPITMNASPIASTNE